MKTGTELTFLLYETTCYMFLVVILKSTATVIVTFLVNIAQASFLCGALCYDEPVSLKEVTATLCVNLIDLLGHIWLNAQHYSLCSQGSMWGKKMMKKWKLI